MKTAKILIVVLGVLAIIALWAMNVYNALVEGQEEVESAWAQVENQYQRRADLVPNLVATVKGYAAHEQETLEGVDAIMTNLEKVCVGVSTADCIPVLLYDKEKHAVCAIHAGWRGTVKRIVAKAIEEMTETYGTQPQQLVAQIGPGIHLDSFEVGNEVYEAFEQAGFDMPTISMKREKWHIDLPECNRQQLITAGLEPQNVKVSPICTYQQSADYFSARRLSINSGRIFTGIML